MSSRLATVLVAGLVLAALVLQALSLPGTLSAQSASNPPQPQNGGDDLLSGFDDPVPGGGPSDAGPSGGEGDDLEAGFEADPLAGPEAAAGAEAAAAEPEESSPVELDGFLRLDSSYNYAHKAPRPGGTDYRGLSKLRLALRLELKWRLAKDWEVLAAWQGFRDFAYAINGREQYTQEVLDQHESEAEIREVYLRGTLFGNLDLKIGSQIVGWGKSDNIRVVDILNPLDNREPGLTDLADLRLPLTMSRFDLYFGSWGLTAIAIHEVKFNKDPGSGSDFFPFPRPPEEVPEDGLEDGKNTEYALSLAGNFSGWDLAFYWAQVFDDQAHFAASMTGPVLRHARITMGGAGLNVALGNWLLKLEAARFSGLRFFNDSGRGFTRVDTLAGVEYAGFTDTTLSFEAVKRHLQNYDPALQLFPDQQPENTNQYVFTYRGSFLREKLDLVAVLVYFGRKAEQGGLQRYSATYELATALDLTGGVVIYTAGDGGNFLLNAAQDNDRVFLDLKWSF